MPHAFIQNLSHAVPSNRLGRFAILGVVGFLLVIIIVQIAYPRTKLLPNTQLQGERVGGRSIQEASAHVDAVLNRAEITVKLDASSEKVHADEVGMDIVSRKAAERAAAYPLWQRFIPLTILQHRSELVQRTFDDERLRYYAEQLAVRHNTQAVNAGVKVQGSSVELIPAIPSRAYVPAKTMAAIKKLTLSKHMTVQVRTESIDPPRNDAQVQKVLDSAKAIIRSAPTVKVATQTVQVTPEQVAGWLDFPEDPATGELHVMIKSAAVREFVSGLQPKAYKAPGTVVVTVVDGTETSRTTAPAGQGVDVDGATEHLTAQLLKGASSVTLPVSIIPPKVTYTYSYSDTQAGLNAFLRDTTRGGMSIAVIELSGRGRSASSNGDRRMTAASIYKLFVAYGVVKRVESGAMSWGQSINNNTVAGCFDSMIVRSDNPCAKALGEAVGWADIEAMMRSIGLGSTTLTGSFTTTANDTARFLRMLQSGTLLSAEGSSRLLDAMHRQIYRSGIPAGVGGSVANKVGFIGSYLHDAAIVYGPHGPYVLVVMTSGSSWSAIASVSRQIHTYLNR